MVRREGEARDGGEKGERKDKEQKGVRRERKEEHTSQSKALFGS
jgi:hypothetical protein